MTDLQRTAADPPARRPAPAPALALSPWQRPKAVRVSLWPEAARQSSEPPRLAA